MKAAIAELDNEALLYNVDGVTLKPDLRKDTAPVNVRQKEQVLAALANTIASCHVDLAIPMTDVYTGYVVYSYLMNAWAVVQQVLGGVHPATSLQNVKSATIEILHDGETKRTTL